MTQSSWNAGLTKETDIRMKRISEAVSFPKPWVSRSNRKYKTGQIVSKEQRRKLSIALRRARATYAPVWNKGLTKKDHPGIASAAKKNSFLTKGRPRPFTSRKQGIRRFWYYGPVRRIKMRSRWEVAYAHWLDKNKIKWIYEAFCFVTDQFSYTPDFYLPARRLFVEIKGIQNAVDGAKFGALRNRWKVKLMVLSGYALQILGLLDAHHRVIAES